MGIALFLHHVCAMAVYVSVNMSLCAQPVVTGKLYSVSTGVPGLSQGSAGHAHMGAKIKGFRFLSL